MYAQTSGYHPNGAMEWPDANTWATGLNPYGSGIIGWRLPITNPIDGTTADDATFRASVPRTMATTSRAGTLYAGSTASEMAYMYYNTLATRVTAIQPHRRCPHAWSSSGWG